MFTVLDEEDHIWSIPLVDFHTHIGKVPIETTKGASQRINRPQDTLDLYEKLKYELYARITENPEEYYITVPKLDNFVKPMYSFVSQNIYKDMNLKGWIADQIVCFPFNDIFHTKTNPKFVKSNDYVRHSLNKFEFVFRFIPFCRVDATEELASQEVIDSAGLGAKGLKLHPLSQHWIDKIVTPETKKVLQTAGSLQLPIIFDVPNKGVAKDITEISIEARKDVDFPIKVVLGHNGFDYSAPEIFQCIEEQDMYTEISGMRGLDVEVFFKNVSKSVDHWYDKILYGTDTNYFGVLQTLDFISFLLSKTFLDICNEHNPESLDPLEIVSRILGLNALNILPLNYQHSSSIGLTTTNNDQSSNLTISASNFITSLKNLVQNKETFYNIAVCPINDTLEYKFYLINEKNLYQWNIQPDGKDPANFILKKSNEQSNFQFDYTILTNFLDKNTELPPVDNSKENIKTIMSIEELIKDNN